MAGETNGTVYKVESKLLIGLIGAMFFIICSAAGIIFANQNDRISALEMDSKANNAINARIAVLESEREQDRQMNAAEEAELKEGEGKIWTQLGFLTSHVDSELADIREHMVIKKPQWGAVAKHGQVAKAADGRALDGD